MLRLIISFHSDYIVNLKVATGEDDVCFNSTTGVKQGCTMAPSPLLFATYFQAANEVLTTTCSLLPTLVFRTAKDLSSQVARSINVNLPLTLHSKKHCMLMIRQSSLTPGHRKFAEEPAADFYCIKAIWSCLPRWT